MSFLASSVTVCRVWAIPCPIPCAKLYDLASHLYSLTLFCTLSTDRRLRIALVGCGRISRNHIKVLAAQHHRASIVAVCDTQIDSLKHIQSFIDDCTSDIPIQAWDVQLFTSYNDLIDSVISNQLDVDLVVLTTPKWSSFLSGYSSCKCWYTRLH